MKTQNIIYEIPKDLEEKPYAHEPTVGFNTQVSKKPRTLYSQRYTTGFLAEGHREIKPEKKYIEIYAEYYKI